MKDYTKQELESKRPTISAEAVISYCLKRLYEDGVHETSDFVSPELTYEELIGALLMGLDAVRKSKKVN